MIALYYHPSNASLAPHLVLEELGLPFELRLVDRANAQHKSPEYLKLNPNGLIPVLVDGDLVLYETAAICLHLADTHPEAGLMPPLGTSERARAYKWLIWLTNTVQPAMIQYFYPDRFVAAGNASGAAEVKAAAQARIEGYLDQLATELARHGGPWLLGERFSLLDPYAWMLCRWTRGFDGRKARDLPGLQPWLARMLARPALQRVVATEGLPPPLV